LIYVTAFFLTFAYVFLKGFQYKNVMHNKWISMATTSYVMNVFEVVQVGAYAKITMQGDWWYALVSGTAAAIAIVGATWFHNKCFHN
jgi:hypothetical protein